MSALKYVLIEMIENDISKMTSDSIIAGIFKGIRIYDPPGDDMLVIIEKDKDTTYLLNTNEYNILSLQKFDGYTKIIHCFRAIEEDQNAALNIISGIVEELNKAGRTIDSDDNIIDTTTYTAIPDDITIIKGGSNVGDTKSTANTKRPFYRGTQSNKVKTSIKTKPEPKCFKRSKKPGKDVLEKMQKKVDEIKAGTYQVKLPVVKGDDIEIASASNDDGDEIYEIYDRNFYMHG